MSGRTVVYGYTPLDELDTVTVYSDSAQTDEIGFFTFYYDAFGRLIANTDTASKDRQFWYYSGQQGSEWAIIPPSASLPRLVF